jgi:hypothetical protein
MELFNSIITWIMKKRLPEVEVFMKYPHNIQNDLLLKLVNDARKTEFGSKYGFRDIHSVRDFQQNVPLSTYEDLYPYIERLMQGEQNLLWHSEIKWFGQSSGTTNARSKFIPVSTEALEDCHYKGGKDLLSIYINNHPETKLFTGKALGIGGSQRINQTKKGGNTYQGDVSAIIMKNLPMWAQMLRRPSIEVALMSNWEEKIVKMAEETIPENITSLSGVPTWTVVLLEKVLEMTGKQHILEVWPNLELFIHGAVSFTPYRSLFQNLIPSNDMRYYETYNATEGFFGIQDLHGSEEMLLMLDYGIYYEFIPIEQIDLDNPSALTLDQVELNKNYALVISTNAGLWRYKIGDTIKFTSLSPYRIKITGRTKHFINAFGEELVIENAENAITRACECTGAIIDNYTAAPKYFGNKSRGCHEWIIEFTKEPANMEQFNCILDETLRKLNSDYDAKRQKDLALQMPVIHSVPRGTFHLWMKKRGKLGGQNKVPRLANNRDYIDDILKAVGLPVA